jgi:hypothetical protein
MTDEQIATLLAAAENRAAILHVSAAWGSDEDGHLMGKLVEVIDAQVAEIARLREALRDIAKYDVGLQNLIDDDVYEETETSRYYAQGISWRQKLARKALEE